MNKPRILIVEDEEIVAADISEYLQQMGYLAVGQAASGEQAIALAGELRPDLVLMDIRLEGKMDGVVAAKEIRQRFHIPSVFLSAYSEEATIQRAKLAEPFGYILKPFEGRELRATIEMALYKHRSEEALRKSEAHLKFALETTETGAWELDLLDHQMERTLAHDRIFGYETLLTSWSYERFLGHVLPEDRPEMERTFSQAVATQSDWSFECRIRRADGKVRWIWVRGGHERDFGGKVNRMSGLVRDITERKRMEDRAQQLQKMEAIGQLTGGVTHEFNNILAAVMMNLELVQTLSPGAEARELLGGALGSCQRAADLIKQLLAFSRQSVMRRQPMDLAAMVSKQCQVLDR
ncbi:MAG: response regulator, partial [Verrucomicrobiota bacterium]